MTSLLFDLTFSDLTSLVEAWGEPKYRASQIWQGLYRQFSFTPNSISNLPSVFRTRLSDQFSSVALSLVRSISSRDGKTVKDLFQLRDGNVVESVLMRYESRNTLCISSQAGCAIGCKFCATGQMGYQRNLSSGEIVAQVIYYAGKLNAQNEAVTNVVLMGMGEPFLNYDNTLEAVDRLNDPTGFNLGARRFTISTVGIIPGIHRFSEEKRQVNLAISLHAADDGLRSKMIPINKHYPIDELIEAAREYVLRTGRRITFEWALVNGVNDSPEQARQLARKLKGLLCHVNAIPLNPTSSYPGQGSTRERANRFRETLMDSGVNCTIRLRRGMDIQAGCGQLAGSK
jgi:23S rRNA (adenine2503-C2)-methyltransferase